MWAFLVFNREDADVWCLSLLYYMLHNTLHFIAVFKNNIFYHFIQEMAFHVTSYPSNCKSNFIRTTCQGCLPPPTGFLITYLWVAPPFALSNELWENCVCQQHCTLPAPTSFYRFDFLGWTPCTRNLLWVQRNKICRWTFRVKFIAREPRHVLSVKVIGEIIWLILTKTSWSKRSELY